MRSMGVTVDIHDIAKRARVSIATVSRTVNRVPGVKPALSRRVWQAVNELGYSPNTQARALVRGKSSIFGVIAPGICQPFYGSIVEDFQRRAERWSYEVILSTTSEDTDRLRLAIRRMVGRRVDGIAIIGIDVSQEIVAEVASARIPLVFGDVAAVYPPARNIRIDYLHGIRHAVQHLAALRHSRIAFVGGPAGSSSALARRESFETSMDEITLSVESRLLLPGCDSLESGKDAMTRLAQFSGPPSAVLCSSELSAVGLMQEATRRGIAVPRELSVIGIGGAWHSLLSVPALTTVQVPQRKLADCLFAALYSDAERQPFPSEGHGYEVTTELVLRSSTAISATASRSMYAEHEFELLHDMKTP